MTPLRPSITTIGKSTRDSHGEIEVSSRITEGPDQERRDEDEESGEPPENSRTSQKTVEATRQARLRSPFSSRSLKTGTNAPDRAASASSARIEVRDLERNRERVDLAVDAEVVGGDHLA